MNQSTCKHDRSVALWLFACCAMIFAMVILGGVTRLTGSGLSMVEWDPIFGIVPPLSAADWNQVFTLYQDSPEYRHINFHMDVHDFKSIYWFEYSHRILGRAIGTVFLLPFLYFLFRGYLHGSLKPKLAVLFVLGGLQGLLGWYMVRSGLVDNPHVSQYRLTAHLGLAILIYGWMLYIAFALWRGRAQEFNVPHAQRRMATVYLLMVFVTILSGGFVAGLKAGHAYNTFPLMDGHLVPEVIFMLDPLWRNFFENIATVQFDHRLLALTVFVTTIPVWLKAIRRQLPADMRTAYQLLLAAAVVQVSLGISTLLLHVPVPLASTHQAGALVLFSIAIYIRQGLSRAQNDRQ